MAAPSVLTFARAQARVLLGLAAAAEASLPARAVRKLAGRIRAQDSLLGGVPATVLVPGRGSGPWPAVVVLPGVTRRGRAHPALRAIGRGLAASGHLVAVAEPEGLTVGELTALSREQTYAAVDVLAARSDAADGRVALVGVSGGATLALLAASERPERVSAVVAVAPCCDVTEAIRVVTTGAYRDGDALVSFATGDFFKLVIARTVVAWLPPGAGRAALRAHLLSLEDYGAEPLASVRAWRRDGLDPETLAALELLSNEDPDRVDELLSSLPDLLREEAAGMSPVTFASRIVAPVELVVGRTDKYFPPADAASFARASPTTRLTVLDSLEHVVPSLAPSGARDLARLDGVLVRFLAALRAPSYSTS
jgi:pimeloyl-ACP methyl ester carboxylesterase